MDVTTGNVTQKKRKVCGVVSSKSTDISVTLYNKVSYVNIS